MTSIHNRALITGASGGLGLHLARLLAGRGYDLILASRNEDRLRELADKLTDEAGVTVDIIPIDLSRPGSGQKLFRICQEKEYSIDLLVNNAGRGMVGSCTEQDCQEMENLVTLNCQTPLALTTLFGGEMARAGYGYILNVGSMVGMQPVPYFAPYAASKSFIHSISLSLHYELKKKGVHVTCLVPGFMDTGFEDSAGITNDTYRKVSGASAMDPARVAYVGLKALFSRKALKVAGLSNRLGAFFSGILPPRVTAFFLELLLRRVV